MILLGKKQKLIIVKKVDFGVYLAEFSGGIVHIQLFFQDIDLLDILRHAHRAACVCVQKAPKGIGIGQHLSLAILHNKIEREDTEIWICFPWKRCFDWIIFQTMLQYHSEVKNKMYSFNSKVPRTKPW